MKKPNIYSKVLVVFIMSFSLFLSGCKQKKLVEKVNVEIAQNLEVIRLSLIFSEHIQSTITGGFTIKDYGYLFLNPYTEDQPFEVGFDLNTSVFNDQDYVNIEPTTVLPNGVPIGLPYAVVELRGKDPISDKFDLYGYVDVLEWSWLGVATLFGFINDSYFPVGLSIQQVFMRDDDGAAAILASVFGPTLDGEGNLLRSGGIALFANVRYLIDKLGSGRFERGDSYEFYAEPNVYVSGPAADEFKGDDAKVYHIEQDLINAFQASNK